jgi:hypothetical protein
MDTSGSPVSRATERGETSFHICATRASLPLRESQPRPFSLQIATPNKSRQSFYTVYAWQRKSTLAPTTASFLPTVIRFFLSARSKGSSTSKRILYHPSVTSTSGIGSSGIPCSSIPPGVHVIFATHKTMGRLAGESCAAIKRKGGREAPFSSLSYLP